MITLCKKKVAMFLFLLALTSILLGQTDRLQPVAFQDQIRTDLSRDMFTERDSNTTLIGHWANGPCYAVDVSGNIACFGNGGYLEIVDISDPANPVELAKIVLPSPIVSVAVSGVYAYVADGSEGLRIIDISNPASPTETGFFDTGSSARGVAVSGAYAYVADYSDGLRIIDISNPASPTETGFFDTGSYASGVVVSGVYAYVADGYDGLRIIDISIPANPTETGFFDTGGSARGVVVSGVYAYVADGSDGLRIIDISNPANPTETGFFDTGGYAYGIAVSGAYAYLAGHYVGLRIIDISNPASPTETGFFTGNYAWGVAVSGAYAYLAGQYDGLRIIDISNPASPTETGFFDTGSSARGVVVSGVYAYVADDSDGLRIIDISNPASPTETGFFDTGRNAEGVAVSGAYAYVADGYDGLRIIDISNPASPTETGFFDTGSYAMDVTVSGAYAYVADGSDGLRIIDISNPANPTETGFFDTGSAARGVAVSGAYAYVADGSDGLRIIDISNPANPTETGFFDTGSAAKGVAVSGAYAYVADHSDGLRIIDISNPASPTETGFFDTGGYAEGVAVSGAYAYVADGTDGLRIIDISNPASLREIAFWDTGGYAYNLFVDSIYAFVANGDNGMYILRNDYPALKENNTPPVAQFTINKSEIILGDSVFVDASESYDVDGNSLEYGWDINSPGFWWEDNTLIEQGKKAYIKPITTGDYQAKLTVFDGFAENDTSKSFHVKPLLENISIDYSFIDTSWYRTNGVYFYDDKFFVAIEPMDVVRIYDLSGDSISFIKDINIPNVIKVFGIYDDLLYVGVPGPVGGYWGPGALNIYQLDTEWQVTPLLENYVPGTRDIFGMRITKTHTIVKDKATIYNIDFKTDPSAPQILAQRTYSDWVYYDIAGKYLYVVITYPERKIEILDKDSLTYVSELVMSPGWKSINADGQLLFVGYTDSLQIYSILNPLEPTILSTIKIPQPFNWLGGNYQIRYSGGILSDNLLVVKNDIGFILFDLSNASNPEIKGYWYSGRNIFVKFHNDNYYLMGYDIVGSLMRDKYFGLNKIHLNFHTSLNESEVTFIPENFALHQNYPNPFNPETTISFNLPNANFVEISIYNILGQKVETILNEYTQAGFNKISFDAKNIATGVYYYKIKAGVYSEIKKMILLK